MGRTTREGIQYIGETSWRILPGGQDPFEPARESDVSRILRRQTDTPAQKGSPRRTRPGREGHSHLGCPDGRGYEKIAGQMKETDCRLFARLRRLLRNFCRRLNPCRKRGHSPPPPANRLLIVAGSIHPATRRQLAALDQTRYVFFTLSQAQMLQEDFADSPEYREQSVPSSGRCIAGGRVVLGRPADLREKNCIAGGILSAGGSERPWRIRSGENPVRSGGVRRGYPAGERRPPGGWRSLSRGGSGAGCGRRAGTE